MYVTRCHKVGDDLCPLQNSCASQEISKLSNTNERYIDTLMLPSLLMALSMYLSTVALAISLDV